MVDNRVHACIYFIQPTGHALKPIDIEFMQRLHTKVNLIPVIAKADTMTEEEIELFKQRILTDIEHHKINIFSPPSYPRDDEETIQENEEIVVSCLSVIPTTPGSSLTISEQDSFRRCRFGQCH